MKSFNDVFDEPLFDKPKARNSVKPYTVVERVKRRVNSAAFDRESYLADGGDNWIEPKRELFFSDAKAKDTGLWQRAAEASRAALGETRWQFQVWWYRKQGGQFE